MLITPDYIHFQTFKEKQEELKLKKFAKQLKKHKETCQKNRQKRKNKKR